MFNDFLKLNRIFVIYITNARFDMIYTNSVPDVYTLKSSIKGDLYGYLPYL